MKHFHNSTLLILLMVQFLTVCLLPLQSSAQTTYEGGVAVINKQIPLNRWNATTQSLESADNIRFKAKTGFNVSDFYARNINYQNREMYFNDSLYNMATCNISTQAGRFMGFLPQLNGSLASSYTPAKNITLIPETVEYVERIQAVGKKYAHGVQIISLYVANSSNPYELYSIGFVDGDIIGSSGIKIYIGGLGVDISYLGVFNGSVFDWIIDFECSRYGLSITVAEYYQYFATQNYTSVSNITRYGYPLEVFTNTNRTAFKFFVDWEYNHELKRYNCMRLSDLAIIGAIQYNSLGIEGCDSRLIGYALNNTLYPDNTFYPDRFDQIYPLFYEPYQNFESAILSFDQIADSDYISMAYEYIGNRWISGETEEVFFPTDELSHFFIDYSNVKRHILLSGNLMYLAPVERVEYIAPYTFRNNLVPDDWTPLLNTFTITDEISGFFHVLNPVAPSKGIITTTTQTTHTTWSVEFYVWITNGQSFGINLTDISATHNLSIYFADSGVDFGYNGISEASDGTLDMADELWHRVVISTDTFSLFTIDVDSVNRISHTVGAFTPNIFRVITADFSTNTVYLDALGVSNDNGYTSGQNLDFYGHTIYTTTYENTIFDKRTAGLVYTWNSDHNRYNLTSTYFNYNITFQIYIDLLRITINDTTTIIDLTPPAAVLRNSYLIRPLQYELWVFPYFDGTDYHLGVDFTFDNNRTAVYLDTWTPIDFTLSNMINTVFYMYDTDTAAVIVFTSAIKSLLKPPSSLTKALTFVNKQYLSRKILYYKFSDGFDFSAVDMNIYITDSQNFTRELTTAKSIIPLNLTATQRIIQANTTQYNSAECLTKITIFNKSAQLYSESGYNASNTLNDTVLNELPITIGLNSADFEGIIPLSAQWYKTVAKAITTAAIIVQQAAANPIGTILSIATAFSTNNYQRVIPIEEVGGTDKSKITLPIVRGGTLVGVLVQSLQSTLGTDNPDNEESACDKLAKIVADLSNKFFGVVLARKIWEILQINKAYEMCNMLEAVWNFLNGVNPTTVGTVKLAIKVEIHGIFSFDSTTATDSWITMIIKFLVPFILPIVFGTLAKRFNPKFVPIGIIIGLIIDGFSKMIGWDYILVLTILGGVGSYFFLTKPTLATNSDPIDNQQWIQKGGAA